MIMVRNLQIGDQIKTNGLGWIGPIVQMNEAANDRRCITIQTGPAAFVRVVYQNTDHVRPAA